MPLLDAYLVQGHQQDLLRAAASSRRLDRAARRRPRRALSLRAADRENPAKSPA